MSPYIELGISMNRLGSLLRLYWAALLYLVLVELVYLLYEAALPRGPHEGTSLLWGLVLAAMTLPSNLIAPYLQWYTAEWLGYRPGDTHAFWPRFIGWQLPILLNTFVVSLIVHRTNRHARAARRSGHPESVG